MGRPISETNPERNPRHSRVAHEWVSGTVSCATFETRTCSTFSSSPGQHLHPDAIALDHLADMRHVPQPFGHQTSDGGGLGFFRRPELQQIVQTVQIQAARHHETAVRLLQHVALRLMLVVNLAQDFFHHVFHGGEAGRVAVLVDHDGHVRAVLLHFAQQIVHRLGLGNKANGARQFFHPAALPIRFVQFEHVAHVHEADDVVDGSLIDRNARVLLVNHQLAQIFERPVGFDGHDFRTRRHHFAHGLVAERHHRFDQLAVVFLDDAFLFAGRDERFDVAGRARAFFVRLGGLGQLHQRLEEAENRGQRPDQQRAQAQNRRQRQQPAPAGFAIQHLRQNVGRNQHGEPGEERRFEEILPGCAGVAESRVARKQTPSSTSSVCLMSENASTPSSPSTPMRSSSVSLKNWSAGRSRERSRSDSM